MLQYIQEDSIIATQTQYKDIQDRTLDILGKSDTTTRNRVKNWINLGYQDFVLRELWPFREKSGDLSIVAGTQEYDLATTFTDMDAENIISVSIQGSSSVKLRYIAYNQLRYSQPDYTTNGQDLPIYYYIKAGKLGLWPSPSGSYTAIVEYFSVPTDLSGDTDVPIIPLAYRQALIHHALSYENDYNGDPDLAQKAMNTYEDFITKARMNLLTQPTDSDNFVMMGPENFINHTGFSGEIL